MAETLAAAHIERVHGIVNGTTNYILTQMAATGASYEEALREAQEMGYAEADPTEDVTGKDAAAKMAILARLAFGAAVGLDQVSYEGIERITADDIAYASELGLSLKLIGSAERIDGGVAVHVHPAFLYADHPLASVNGAFNAVTIESPAITEITLSGPGAGGIADRERRAGRRDLGDDPAAVAAAAARWSCRSSPTSSSRSTCTSRWPTGRACWPRSPRSSGLQGVSIRSVVQKGLGEEARLVMVMHPVLESKFRAAVELLSRLDFVREPPRVIRVIEETF